MLILYIRTHVSRCVFSGDGLFHAAAEEGRGRLSLNEDAAALAAPGTGLTNLVLVVYCGTFTQV